MFDIGFFFDTPAKQKRREAQLRAEIAERIPLAVPWTSDIKWQPQLNIQSKTFPTYNLFPAVKAYPSNNVNTVIEKGTFAQSPQGTWVYCIKQLSAGSMLLTMAGARRGDVLFDSPIGIPALHKKDYKGFEEVPWMSITPMEALTLRPGTKLAKGHTVVAGLGLGYQLIEVSKRKTVERITLVEESQELVDWLWPQIKPLVTKPVDIIVGDAYKVLPKLTADVALVDIFFHYGNNDEEHAELVRDCKNIKKVWAWGTAKIGDAR